jgi:nicotinamide-nucleotide amidase
MGGLMCGAEDDRVTVSLERGLGELLTQRRLTLAVAESCTGGLISHRITNVPGSSRYFLLGIVAYSDVAKKEQLGIDQALLEEAGAVSRDVALAMARGIRAVAHSDIGVGVTGIAGPGGGTAEKPVGLVFMAVVTDERERVERNIFAGGRLAVKEQMADAALALVLELAHA